MSCKMVYFHPHWLVSQPSATYSQAT
ncbi:hypothetical protein F383_12706 [Gossypium arboreum]|uniref:Uncharacterized protein n=1 Tax=Gossypium arboreum TaxID=29729 RepID=A0A0B0N9J9_GOSAR|nr:hypothetical protein F383_12706 [Gossypium arboreum]